MSSKTGSASTSRWLRAHLAALEHSFYSPVPEKFYLDNMVVSHLNRHFRDHDLKYFKTCFKVLTGATSKVPANTAAEIHESVKVMHDMVHGRYIISAAGLESVRDKHSRGVYGRCPRLFCEEYPLLPVGMDDQSGVSLTQCFCAKCRDVYRAPSHVVVDSVAFGTSLPHVFLERYQDLCPSKPERAYTPKIYGFRIHPSSPVVIKHESGAPGDDQQQ